MSYFECTRCKASLGVTYDGDGVYAVPPCDCGVKPAPEPPVTCCWYRYGCKDEWKTGFFHQWSIDCDQNDPHGGQYPVAIVEDATNNRVHVVDAGQISFSPNCPTD